MNRTSHYSLLYLLLFPIPIFIPFYFILLYFHHWLYQLSPGSLAFGSILSTILLRSLVIRHGECWHQRIGSLYAAQGEANKCLDLLHQETLKDSLKISYSCTYGSCTAVLMFSRMEVASQELARAKSFIDYLEEDVARPGFIGTSHFGAGDRLGDMKIHSFASLVCKNSWGGIAHRIAK